MLRLTWCSNERFDSVRVAPGPVGTLSAEMVKRARKRMVCCNECIVVDMQMVV